MRHFKATVYQVLMDSREPLTTAQIRNKLGIETPLNISAFLHDGEKGKFLKKENKDNVVHWSIAARGRNYMARVRAEIPSVEELKVELERRLALANNKSKDRKQIKNSDQKNLFSIDQVSRTERRALESLSVILDENREMKILLRDIERKIKTLLYAENSENKQEIIEDGERR